MLSLNSEPSLTYFYHGRSMRGTFRRGDTLYAEPVTLKDLHPGDVIVYQKTETPPPPHDTVVHRIIRIVPGGVITQGDTNPHCDIVLAEQIIGRVTKVIRNNRTRHVTNGYRGLLRGYFLHCWHPTQQTMRRFVHRHIFPLGRGLYRWLRTHQILARVWHPQVTQIYFETENSYLIKYVVKQQIIGIWNPQNQRFTIRKPYDLVIPMPHEHCDPVEKTGLKTHQS